LAFPEAYADQNECDYATLRPAAATGRIYAVGVSDTFAQEQSQSVAFDTALHPRRRVRSG
jgi:hypothetical protein